MIALEGVSKAFVLPNGACKPILENTTLTFPSFARVGILGRNGAGKSTLLKLIAGTQDVDHGHITRSGSVSWPIGFAGAFHPDLSGAQNARFVARVYGVDTRDMLKFAEDFAELGAYFHQPLRQYSSGMRARLAFAVSMAVPFSTYLIDEVTSVGDARFRRKCHDILKNRLRDHAALIVSHSEEMLRETCTHGAVLERGRLQIFGSLEEAFGAHKRNLGI